jgi:hypothetical protein
LLGSPLSVMGKKRGVKERLGVSCGRMTKGVLAMASATTRVGDNGVAERMATITAVPSIHMWRAESEQKART